MNDAESLLADERLADADRAALGLLVEYKESFWLRRPRDPCFRVLDMTRLTVDWNPGHRAWREDAGDACDRAILLTAMHLAGEAIGAEALGSWWQHLDRSALASVLRAIAVVAGARAAVTDVGEVAVARFDRVGPYRTGVEH